MPKAKRNPVISQHAARRIGESNTPIALLTDLWALHLLPYAQEQWAEMLTPNEWQIVREAADITRFDTRRDPKTELASLVSLAFEYAEGGMENVVESEIVGKIKRFNLVQCVYVLFAIARAEADGLQGDEWWRVGIRPSSASSQVSSGSTLTAVQATD